MSYGSNLLWRAMRRPWWPAFAMFHQLNHWKFIGSIRNRSRGQDWRSSHSTIFDWIAWALFIPFQDIWKLAYVQLVHLVQLIVDTSWFAVLILFDSLCCGGGACSASRLLLGRIAGASPGTQSSSHLGIQLQGHAKTLGIQLTKRYKRTPRFVTRKVGFIHWCTSMPNSFWDSILYTLY